MRRKSPTSSARQQRIDELVQLAPFLAPITIGWGEEAVMVYIDVRNKDAFARMLGMMYKSGRGPFNRIANDELTAEVRRLHKQGRSLGEIAQDMDTSRNAVKGRLYRDKKRSNRSTGD
jgi:hypothetical protein